MSESQVGSLNFGQAVEAVKQGKSVARAGWNGKNMCVYLNKGNVEHGTNSPTGLIGGVSQDLFQSGDTGTVTRMPNLNMKAADGSTVTGWLASQTDILAEDWQIVN